MKKISLLVLSCLVFVALNAQDVVKERYSASGGLLGAANFSKFKLDGDNPDNVDYDTKTGLSFGAWLNLPVSSGFSIEPQIMYSSYKYMTNSTTTMLLNDGSLRFISIPVLLKLHAGDKFAFTVGPQVDFFTSRDDENHVAVAEDFTKTSFSLSGGVELFPHGKVSVFGRYIHGFTNMDNRTNHTTNTEYQNRVFQVGLKVKLFGKRAEPYQATTVVTAPLDTDGDGITDDMDKCPTQAGIAKYNGCPIPDTDGDGINDEEDKCPNQAGTAKYNGCPVPDTDGDGINDEEDKCPNQAGPKERDGCPVTDRDNDGVNDEQDKCPDVAGVASNNGCPEIPANVSKTLGLSASNIAFGTTNAKLTTKSNASLDQIVAVMNEHPTMHIKVEAHTDNAGDDDANMKLSKDRADAVKAYLVSKGISEDRIATEGFGSTMPVGDNTSSAGRAKNRRVEIKVEY
jgi:outer membrane protein OmpA-like peptidoglycan-associated protein